MAETTYTYSIATDTPSGTFLGENLIKDIVGSAILVAYDRVDTSGDVISVVFKDALTAGDETILNGLVAAHDSTPAKTPTRVKNQPASSGDLELLIHGSTFIANLDSDTDFDITLAEDRELQGAEAGVWNASPGDYLELSVHHPTLGMLSEFAHQAYILPDGIVSPGLSDSTQALPAGLFIRLTYHSTATAGLQPIVVVNFRWYRKAS